MRRAPVFIVLLGLLCIASISTNAFQVVHPMNCGVHAAYYSPSASFTCFHEHAQSIRNRPLNPPSRGTEAHVSNYRNVEYALAPKWASEAPYGWWTIGCSLQRTYFYPSPPPLIPRCPINITLEEVFTYTRGMPYTGDVDGDGVLDLVVVTSDGITVLKGDGSVLWSISLPVESVDYEAVVKDIDGDGLSEILAGTRYSSTKLRVYVLDDDGSIIKTFTKTNTGSDSSCGVSGIITMNGSLIVVVRFNAGYSLKPRGLSLYNYSSGEEIWHYAIGPCLDSVSIRDIDGDGKVEFFLDTRSVSNGNSGSGTGDDPTTYDTVTYILLIDSDGNSICTKRLSQGYVLSGISDLDGDGTFEIVVFESHDGYYRGKSKIHVLDPQGNILRSFSEGPKNEIWAGFSIADLDLDGLKEIIAYNRNGSLMVFDAELNLVRSCTLPTSPVCRFATSDIDDDGYPEIIILDAQGTLHILDGELNELASLSLSQEPENFASGIIIVSDINGDGREEIIVSRSKLHVVSVSVTAPILYVIPGLGTSTTTISAIGYQFSPNSTVTIFANDTLVALSTTDRDGAFEVDFNIQGPPGFYIILAYDEYGLWAGDTFDLYDYTPLNVSANVGSVHFRGEIIEFYILTAHHGRPVNVTSLNATLYWPSNITTSLFYEYQSPGLYKVTFGVPADAPIGTYTLLVVALLRTSHVEAWGSAARSFVLIPTLTGWNARLIAIQDGVGLTKTYMGYIRINLTAINAKLIDIQGRKAILDTALGQIEAELDALVEDVDTMRSLLEGWTESTTNMAGYRVMAFTRMELKDVRAKGTTIMIYLHATENGRLHVLMPKALLAKLGISPSTIEVVLDWLKTGYEMVSLSSYYMLVVSCGPGDHTVKIYLQGAPIYEKPEGLMALGGGATAAVGVAIWLIRRRRKKAFCKPLAKYLLGKSG